MQAEGCCCRCVDSGSVSEGDGGRTEECRGKVSASLGDDPGEAIVAGELARVSSQTLQSRDDL